MPKSLKGSDNKRRRSKDRRGCANYSLSKRKKQSDKPLVKFNAKKTANLRSFIS